MATIPAGTKFLGVDPSFTDLTEKKGTKVDRKSEYFSLEDITATVGVGSEGPQGVQGPAGPPGPVGPAGLEWQGAWDTDSSYAVNDAVGFNGASWFCISEVTGTGNSNPEVDITSWALLAAQGAQGPQGVQGPTGPQGPQGEDGTASLPYLEYSCILTQEFENEFSKTIINNELSSDITITRILQGRFGIKFPGTVDVNKIVLGETLVYTPNGYALLYVDYYDTYTLYDVIIDTFENLSNIPSTKSDFILFKTPLSFKIYN